MLPFRASGMRDHTVRWHLRIKLSTFVREEALMGKQGLFKIE